MSENSPLVVLGGNGLTGRYLLEQLIATQKAAFIVSRRVMDLPALLTAVRTDLNHPNDWVMPEGAIVISLLPLWLLTKYLPQLKGMKSIIATGSTSLYAKAKSDDDHERLIVELLKNAEADLKKWAEEHQVSWTVLRPTTIYDCRHDKNVARLAAFIKRWHFLPLAIPANGLRQPIHAADVAKATLKCINNVAVQNKAFNIAGAEILTYRSMTERIFLALHKTPRYIFLPVWLLQIIFGLVKKLGLLKETSFGATFFHRMNEDLIFETKDGLEAIEYNPQAFKPLFENII